MKMGLGLAEHSRTTDPGYYELQELMHGYHYFILYIYIYSSMVKVIPLILETHGDSRFPVSMKYMVPHQGY